MISENKRKIEFWEEQVDKRKMTLCFISHLWIILVGFVAGVLLGFLSYSLYHLITDKTNYQGYSEFYLDFATDEKGDAYQWYNGYTWTGLMSAEPIVTYTLDALKDTDVDASFIEKSTVAEIKSDIRVLRVTFTDSSEELCGKLQTATENALIKLGDSVKEFNSIALIKTAKPERVYVDDRHIQAMELGGIVGLVIAIFVVWIGYILDDRVRTLSDLTGVGAPALGVVLKKSDDKLSDFFQRLYSDNVSSQLKNLSTGSETAKIYNFDISKVSEGLDVQAMEVILAEAMKSDCIKIDIPYGKISKSFCKLMIDTIRDRGGNILGLCIIDGDNRFYKAYYALNK